jgi:hypothetical protein
LLENRVTETTWNPHFAAPTRSVPGESIDDYRARRAAEQQRQDEIRQQELAEQRSAHNTPDMRIRAWEKAHWLRLPSQPAHPVLQAVATATGLPLALVEEEQRRRAERAQAAATAAATAASAAIVAEAAVEPSAEVPASPPDAPANP